MHPAFEAISMEEVARESERFSFAQLREVYITAGQRAFERKDAIMISTKLILGLWVAWR
jgi:hypothetical protein